MKAWDITRKDLKLLTRDVRTFVVLLALPVLFIWIIGMITGRMTGFDEPNRVLKIRMLDEIDYDALAVDQRGEPLPEDEVDRRQQQARNTFVKIFNSIQEKSGFEVSEAPIAEPKRQHRDEAAARARKQYEEGETAAMLRVGPHFFERVLAISHRDIMDSSRGGIAFSFQPPGTPAELDAIQAQREGLEQRLSGVLGIPAGEFGIYEEGFNLEEAVVVFQLPPAAADKIFDVRWQPGEASPLLDKLAAAARPLELEAIYPTGLHYGLESLNMRVETEAPQSATHDLVETVILYSTFDNIKLFPLCANTQARSQIGSSCERLEAQATGQPLAKMEPQPVEESASRVYQEVIPGYTVLFVFFLINIMARSFLHEKALGTLRRLRIAPVRPTSLLAGKTLPFLFVSLVQTALLFLFGKFFFGMSWGPRPALLIPVILCTSLAATALGLLVATLVTSESQVSAYANLVVITTGLISGSMFPRDWLPDLMQDISLVTPHAWALLAYDEILSIRQDPDTVMIFQCCAALIGFALLFFAIGTLRFGKVD